MMCILKLRKYWIRIELLWGYNPLVQPDSLATGKRMSKVLVAEFIYLWTTGMGVTVKAVSKDNRKVSMKMISWSEIKLHLLHQANYVNYVTPRQMSVTWGLQTAEFVPSFAEWKPLSTLGVGSHLVHLRLSFPYSIAHWLPGGRRRRAELSRAAQFNWKKCSQRHLMPLAPKYVLIYVALPAAEPAGKLGVMERTLNLEAEPWRWRLTAASGCSHGPWNFNVWIYPEALLPSPGQSPRANQPKGMMSGVNHTGPIHRRSSSKMVPTAPHCGNFLCFHSILTLLGSALYLITVTPPSAAMFMTSFGS